MTHTLLSIAFVLMLLRQRAAHPFERLALSASATGVTAIAIYMEVWT